ncbi:alpha beta hydrolase fold-3 domain-containing protein [Xylaria bambusicola]|uniref:alpha beta hydrolase fold-3 domain-containing protein n=1 Tax=Xylaria bambusicola TaxID=326684 RepID=UPI002007673D|nr:alpha beta hydrolase fold-3 domain-containing protein [Xylaria bambusicola]KAI0514469.1 alpha beta hydrolase fold-3 domain-containing protein [Xylaria bambusicola]
MGSIDEIPGVVNALQPSIAERLDPVYLDIYNRYQAPRMRCDQVPYEVYKENKEAYSFPTAKVTGPRPEVASNTIYRVPVSHPEGEVDVQVYVPTAEAISNGGLASSEGRLSALVNFHGGGFVIGDLNSDEPLVRQLCQGAGCVVVNADYRTAPEFPHPTSVLDSWDVLKWVFAKADELNVDTSRIAVSGLSAGGCIAAVLSILARDDPTLPPLKLQILIVPLADVRYVPVEGSCKGGPYESYVSNEFAPMLPLSRLVWFYNYWLGTGPERSEKAEDFRASPLLAKSHENLAPASIRAAEVDPLVSEAKAYHEKLRAAGTQSKIKIYKGQGHTFPQWDGFNPGSKEFVQDCINDLKEAFKL